MLPITKSWGIMVRSTPSCNNQGENDKANHDQNFGTAEPEFELSEQPDAEIVDCDDGGQEKSYVDSRACSCAITFSCFVKPVSDNKG